jgi:hypothetical protein
MNFLNHILIQNSELKCIEDQFVPPLGLPFINNLKRDWCSRSVVLSGAEVFAPVAT